MELMKKSLIKTILILLISWKLAASETPENSTPFPLEVRYGEGRELCRLSNREINESSGLAWSTLNSNVLWTHNDSDDSPRIFAINLQCEDLGTFHVSGAKAFDWEDMASFTMDEKTYLLIADIGDNGLNRKKYNLYFIEEPLLNKESNSAVKRLEVSKTIQFTYEDGPHNSESVAVDPVKGSVYLISKNIGLGGKVYELPLPEEKSDKMSIAKKIATLRISFVTAMDISPDGLRAVVLTYNHAYEYKRQENEDWSEAFSRKPRLILMPGRYLGESICYGSDGKTLYLTSEMDPTPLWEVPIVKR